MSLSAKLGIAGVILTVLFMAFAGAEIPLSFVFAALACVLGLLAAHRGSKWWLALPCVIVAAELAIFTFVARIP